jgi:hypothetical protein
MTLRQRLIDGGKFREIARKIQQKKFARLASGQIADIPKRIFRPKGETDLEALVSVIGPIGLTLEEATYPTATTVDGKPLNAMYDHVIRMTKEELPPAKAFWLFLP